MALYNTFGYNILHKEKNVKHVIGKNDFDSIFILLPADPRGTYVRVPQGWGGRVDLIANAVYGNPDLWSFILIANAISDPFEVKGNDILKIPIL